VSERSRCRAAADAASRALPLLVREAAHHGRGIFAVGEEACSDGLAGMGGRGGGVNRLSAYASFPCYLCVAVALAVSKALA
jgi:hypothetical protein